MEAPTTSDQQPDIPDQTKKSGKCFLNCWCCRHDGKKCESLDGSSQRVWDASGIQQKCKRCTYLGKACGPPERAPEQQKRVSANARAAGQDSPNQSPTRFRQKRQKGKDQVYSAQGTNAPKNREEISHNLRRLATIIALRQLILRLH